MLHSILVGLDGSTHSQAAIRLGIDWARRDNALLVGLAILDEPAIASAAPVLLGGAPYADPVVYRERMSDARRQADQFLEQFALQCAEARVACKVLEDVGLPAEQILLEAQRYDLVIMGQKTRFHFEIQERYDDTLWKVLKGTPRPVVVAPESWDEGRSVVVAYDGSLQTARALSAFCETGVHRSRDVHVVTAHPDRTAASRIAERAADFLRFHDIKPIAHAIGSSARPAEVILGELRSLGADLLVMGAYGQSTLKDFFLGSATRSLLRESHVPMFLFH